jgi:hypothetical protein
MEFGKYCPGKEGKCVNFYVQPHGAGDEHGYTFNFMERVPSIPLLFGYPYPSNSGGFFTVTKASYDNFVSNVIGKDTEWNGVINGLRNNGNTDPQTIPGTWSWLSEEEKAEFNKETDDAGGKPRYSSTTARALGNGVPGGSSRKSKRTHRKPTKRRRNRRGNRKTKKN